MARTAAGRETGGPNWDRISSPTAAPPGASSRLWVTSSESTVVEIGPGRGVLTGLLVGRAKHVIAIELDRVLGAQLRMKYAHQSGIEILEGDVLDIDFESLLRRPRVAGDANRPFTGPARVVGNLPYYITSPILQHLLRVP